MKIVMIHGQNHKGSTYNIGRMIANKVLRKKKVKVGIKTKALFMIMRMMQNGGMGSSEGDRAYWEQNGWLEKERPWR